MKVDHFHNLLNFDYLHSSMMILNPKQEKKRILFLHIKIKINHLQTSTKIFHNYIFIMCITIIHSQIKLVYYN